MRDPALSVVLSALYLIFTALWAVVAIWPFTLIWLLERPFDPKLRVLHRFTRFWAWVYVVTNWTLRVELEGVEKIEKGRVYVYTPNHQSLLDILTTLQIPRHFKFVSKIENFRIPIIGWTLTMNRYVRLKRGDRQSVREMLKGCEDRLVEGSSMLIFPEGTRSEDGTLRPFATGAFTIAKKLSLPVLPICIHGASDALPKRGLILRGKHKVTLRILDPIEPVEFEELSPKQLSLLVRDRIARELDALASPDPRREAHAAS